MARKQRILLEQRRALRIWAHQQHPKPSQKACIAWFHEKYGITISQSTVSESLSTHFEAIDTHGNAQSSRLRTGQWPDLENLLFLWQQQVEEQGGLTSGELLRQKAQQIWHQLPQYSNLSCPEFSIGWLQKFKKRHNIREYTRHGELGSVPETAEDEMVSLRTLAGEYNEEDIYNMDETGLYWRNMPSRGLASQSRPGMKKDKSRISLVLAVNTTGSDRLPIWIIGKYRTPRALRNISISTMGGQWRWNPKAWMNTAIMIEWLQAFYSHIGPTRRVLLTMDNFAAHVSALETTPPPQNISIAWLPKNSTSRFQPLDQGIIQSFKSHYRRQWLGYMLGCYERSEDPLDSMNLYLAIRWIMRSWNHYVLNTTIYNCFRKSTLVITPLSLPISADSPNIISLYERVQRAGNIQDIMAIANFLNPAEEDEQELEGQELDPEAVLQGIMAEHLGLQQEDEDNEDSEQPGKPEHSIQSARQALQVVIEFTEGRDDVKTARLRAIELLEQELEAIDISSRTQTTLDSWII
jgi:DDE superfamily endonuclease/Fission yeast centromere protein N-terminal domain/Tc5 transposase DNA-binding domain